jgi:hypothetical protein
MKALIAACAVALALTGCTAQDNASQAATDLAANRTDIYIMKNDVEFKNYNKRQQIADDPTTILWCTFAFPIPSSPLVTVAVVGKLTSGGKRPFDTQPGPDGMYGTSGEYRYGFAPGDVYSDFYGLPTYCTNKPMIWQRQDTKIVMGADPVLMDAQNRAQAAMKSGNTTEANRILSEAIQGGK